MIITIGKNILLKIMNSNSKYKLIDLRPKEEYEKEHIKNAISIPYETDNKISRKIFRKNETIVFYSENNECIKSNNFAKILEDMNFQNIYIYEGGIEDYKKNYLPMEIIYLPEKITNGNMVFDV